MRPTPSAETKEATVKRNSRKNRRAGFAMIEVLMTIVVLAVGALGLAGLQLAAMKYNKESVGRTKATLLAEELSDRMRANMQGVQSGSYTENNGYTAAITALAAITAPSCGGSTTGTTSDCTYAQMATLDLANWSTDLVVALPQGTGAVVPITSNGYTYDIVVMWMEKSFADAGGTDATCPTPLVVGVRCLHTPFIP
jgi:type IV pilus assembly protein PilV